MRKLVTLIAAFVLLQCATSAQYFTTSGLLIRPPGQSNGVIITAPTGLTGNIMFTLPSTAGTILVDDGSGVSSAWLLGGNNLDSAGSVGRKLGSTTAHDFQLIAGDTANVRLVMHNATNSFATGPGTTFRLVEPVGAGAINYSSFVAQAQTKNIDYTLPATAGTANQVLQIASTPTPTDSSVTLEWATPSGGGGGNFVATNTDTSYTVLPTNDLLQVSVDTGSVTITLPLANSLPAGKKIVIKAVTATPPSPSPGEISLAVTGSETINNQPLAAFFGNVIYPGQSIRLYSDGANWYSW